MIGRFLAFLRHTRWIFSTEYRATIERIECLVKDSNGLHHKSALWHQIEDDVRGDIYRAYAMVVSGNAIPGVPFEVWSEEIKEWDAAAARLHVSPSVIMRGSDASN